MKEEACSSDFFRPDQRDLLFFMKSSNKSPAYFFPQHPKPLFWLLWFKRLSEMLLWGVEGEGPWCSRSDRNVQRPPTKSQKKIDVITRNLTPSVFWLPSVSTVDPRRDCFFIKCRTTSSERDITSSSSFWDLTAWTYAEHAEVLSPLSNY